MDRAREQSLAMGRPWLRVERTTRTSRERLAWWMAAEVAVDASMLAPDPSVQTLNRPGAPKG